MIVNLIEIESISQQKLKCQAPLRDFAVNLRHFRNFSTLFWLKTNYLKKKKKGYTLELVALIIPNSRRTSSHQFVVFFKILISFFSSRKVTGDMSLMTCENLHIGGGEYSLIISGP